MQSARSPPTSPLTAGCRAVHAGRGTRHPERRHVSFAYPSRPDTKVLEDFSVLLTPGQYVGVVGQSGSGKSTIALLIARVYDVDSGVVCLPAGMTIYD